MIDFSKAQIERGTLLKKPSDSHTVYVVYDYNAVNKEVFIHKQGETVDAMEMCTIDDSWTIVSANETTTSSNEIVESVASIEERKAKLEKDRLERMSRKGLDSIIAQIDNRASIHNTHTAHVAHTQDKAEKVEKQEVKRKITHESTNNVDVSDKTLIVEYMQMLKAHSEMLCKVGDLLLNNTKHGK
jgi:hypothetical protein